MGEMSRKDEIMEVMKKHEKIVDEWGSNAVFPPYINVATDIEKLFEVDGKVEYVVQKGTSVGCVDLGKHVDCDIVKASIDGCRAENPDSHYQLIKRTTIDQIIEG